jgi:hypothetical protein
LFVDAIAALVESLTPDNVKVTVVSKAFEGKTELTEGMLPLDRGRRKGLTLVL